MKKSMIKAWVLLIVLCSAQSYMSASSVVSNVKKTSSISPLVAEPAEKAGFLPGIWESVKKGLNATDQEVKEEEDSEIRTGLSKEAQGFEDPVEKTMATKMEELQAMASKQDVIADAISRAKGLAFIYAQKQVLDDFGLEKRGSPSLVKVGSNLSQFEAQFIPKRVNVIRPALEKFTGEAIPAQTIRDSTIAFAGTGGGYRAMILTIGYLAGLEKIGLLDGIMYTAGLSGSTWAIGPWISQGGRVDVYKQSLEKKITDNSFNVMKLGPGLLTGSANMQILTKYILWPKFLWGQPIRSIDFYGYLLGQVLLGRDGYKKHLSDQWTTIQGGNYPFPIYTAVSMSKKNSGDYSYDWYEFNPVEVRVNLDEKIYEDGKREIDTFLSVPIKAFGSEFKAGASTSTGHVTIAPEAMFGYWLGTFGSAFAINSKDINEHVLKGLKSWKEPIGTLKGLMNIVGAGLVGALQSVEGVGTARISPAQVLNPFNGYPDAPGDWLRNKKYLTLVDAGVSNNIPLRPLLWPARKVKFIIIGESSTTAASARELKNFFEYAQKVYGYTYVRADNEKNKTLRLYKDKNNNPAAPRIIYVTYYKDLSLMDLEVARGVATMTPAEKLKRELEREDLKRFIKSEKLESFDPDVCINGEGGKLGFCHTLNFDYSVDQFKQLSGIAEFNVWANKDVIADFIRDGLHEQEDVGGWGTLR